MSFSVTCILLVGLALIAEITGNFTKINRKNVLLFRQRRYLNFPKGSNMAYTISMTKYLLRDQPQNWASIIECDIPFALPSDTRSLFSKKRIKRFEEDRMEIFERIENGLSTLGLNGTECLQKLICEVKPISKIKEKSIFKDILTTIFSYTLGMEFFDPQMCGTSRFESCDISFINIFSNIVSSHVTNELKSLI